ncbi:hypothetical protein GCG54_00003797 [Colletotrichum gloeosporioides]|uniref:NB-ARC domain-containing protein n=1 Tax=Colletotrichum gloeosporioides TaxID=474922 RepID=A0A8H4FHC3_COLGL|nr:uncharacterized protein GCG54_00003797 [Colletotrichum gloeosporioides]KAF3802338.1 hypothetical protein GCG54_00003797 [Colletotrichum gloeosporioides]
MPPEIISTFSTSSKSYLPFYSSNITPKQQRVQEQSAIYKGKNVRNIGLSVDHYRLNQFGSRLSSYDMIKSKLVKMCERLTRSPRRYYHVPSELVDTYIERVELSQELEAKLQVSHETSEVLDAVLLQGLGDTVKSQLALRYAEEHRDRFSPILWLDAKDEESMRHSFRRCALELQVELPKDHSPVFEYPAVLAVNFWLHDRIESDEEWLVIVDNANDVSWGVRKIIPKGKRGSLIITSQDNRSV